MFKKYIHYLLISCFICNIPAISFAEQINSEQIKAGIHYKRLPEKIRSNKHIQQLTNQHANKVQVLMFFSYGCFVCRRLVQPFDHWAMQQAKEKIYITKVPVCFHNAWKLLAQLYYTVEVLQKAVPLNEIIFTELHEHGKPLWRKDKAEELLLAHGISRDLFQKTFDSFNVNNKVRWADDLYIAFALAHVPNIVINGPYSTYVTNLVMTKDPKFLFAVVDYLVKKELK